ncbi:hypothetical protein KEM54_002564 [Ascosphaera aggregata]|nr:hypothetical protein KEM54_002564 [Ascosphaera aggregata]
MSTAIHAPAQFKQPSRKGKKAWRKNVDVTDVQEGLRALRDEQIHGGVLAERPSDDLFIVDTKGDKQVQKQLASRRLLKSEEILAKRSAIPAVDSRKRSSNDKVTDGVVVPSHKKQRSDWVTHKEWVRLKKVAAETSLEQVTAPSAVPAYDPWGDAPIEKLDDSKFSFLPKPKPVTVPSTLKQAPVVLTANQKPVPAVKKPDPGQSYNPEFTEWDRLLTEEGQREVEAEKKRLVEQAEEEERQRLIAAAQAEPDDEAQPDDESEWEGFESEYEPTPEWLNKKRPQRKTSAQRNRVKRRKEAERKAKWEAQMKKKEEQMNKINRSADTAAEEGMRMEKLESSSDDEGDDRKLRRRAFGRHHVPEKRVEVVLPDELQDSLRLLKPEGNLLDDRFRNFLVNGKLEVRKRIVQPRKRKIKYTEKWGHKDFTI